MVKRSTFAAIALSVAVIAGFAAPAAAHGNNDGDNHSDRHHSHHGRDDSNSGDIEIAADNLNNPRQITVHDGAIYVAEAGTGGPTCIGDTPETTACVGFTGSVTRVDHGDAERIQTGLISVASPEGDTVGVDSLAFRDDRLYGIATGTCEDLTGVPTEFTDQLGKILRLRGDTDVSAVADPGAFECTTNPDGQEADTDPYGLAVKGHTFYVADAAGNDIVKAKHGTVSLASVLSTTGQPVPTSLAWGPDGALYIGTLNFEAGPGGASVYRLDTDTGALSVYASGLTAITSLSFGRHGTLYVTEWTTGFGAMGPLPDGDVISIPWGGGLTGRQTIGTGTLHFPTGVAYDDGALYVSNWGIATGVDGPFGPGGHGQLLKITL
jgi:hypothetical protein